MKRSLLFILITVLVVACSKDKFTSEPKVEIRSIQPATVLSGNVIRLLGSYTDEEGDIDSVYIVYKWFNGNTATLIDTLMRFPTGRLGIPAQLRQSDIAVEFEYNTYNQTNMLTLPGVTRDTSAALGLILIDKTRKRSNYVESNKIRLKKP
ncbi:MAG: hypothetical protein RLZ11_752 [Bacteroidota bacterium]|jgi:hypothetical protein